MAWLLTYWYLPTLVLIVLALFLVKKLANKKARSAAMDAIHQLEKEVFDTIDKRLEAISELGYNLLPLQLRLFVSENAFKIVVKEVYDEVKNVIDKLEGNDKPAK